MAESREAFYTLSSAVIDLEKTFGHSSVDTHYLVYCPMANDYEGAYWLQRVKLVWNSYWGKKMLRCGSIKYEFASTQTGGESPHDAH